MGTALYAATMGLRSSGLSYIGIRRQLVGCWHLLALAEVKPDRWKLIAGECGFPTSSPPALTGLFASASPLANQRGYHQIPYPRVRLHRFLFQRYHNQSYFDLAESIIAPTAMQTATPASPS